MSRTGAKVEDPPAGGDEIPQGGAKTVTTCPAKRETY